MNIKLKALVSILFLMSFHSIYSQIISVDNTVSPQDLIENNLIQGCVEVSNITSQVNGSVNGFSSYGYFNRELSNFPFEDGIVLTTGNANSGGNTTNVNILNDGEDNWGTDSDLETALGITNTFNATSIEFDFISISNLIQFNYILASEEYFGNFPCEYSDGFAFLIKEAGTNNPYVNIALIPGTNIPVNTNTIHDAIAGFCEAENDNYFDGYSMGDTNYNGRTTVLTATAAIQPNVQYHIKLVIADQTDENYDSAVFIQGNSFNPSVDLGPDVSTCATSYTINGDIQNPLATYSWYQDNNLLVGENNSTLNVTQTGEYRVEISIPLNNMDCIIEDTINISLNSEQPIGDVTNYEQCDDTSADEIESFDLSTKSNEIISLLPPSTYDVTYHYSSNESQNNSNPITGVIQNTGNPQTIFVRIEDTNSGCLSYAEFNLIVNPLPNISTPTPIVLCDDGAADGSTNIDLSTINNEVTQGDNSLIVSYHYSQNDADSGINQIPSDYVNSNPNETLFIRVEDPNTGCYSLTTLSITVIDRPVVNVDPEPINGCDDDDDGFTNFDLTSSIDDILQGLTGVSTTFHETYEDAETGDNPIADETNYQNIIENVQTVYVRIVDDITGCATVVSLDLHTNLLVTGTNIHNFYNCDDESGDGISDFDLISIAENIINDLNNVTITFFETEDDLNNNINPLNNNVPYTVTNSPHTIYLQIETPDCIYTTQIDLIVNPPIVLQPVPTLDYCDTDDDGYTLIDLSYFDNTILNGINDASIQYFISENDANNNQNPLPNTFTNTNNPQTLYARARNNITGCYDTTPIEINVIPAPTVTTPNDIVICDNDQDGFSIINLNNIIPEITTNTTDLTISFHNNLNDLNNDSNSINNIAVYNASTETIYTRIESDITGCYATVQINIIVNTLPIFTPISDYENCETDGNSIADFLLVQKDAEILNDQTGKQVLYFATQNDAENRTNIIDKNNIYNNTSSPQTIYVRVENLSDSDCYGTSSFNLLVGSIPIFNPPTNYLICDDISNDGFAEFDLEEKVTEISQGSPENLTITFYTNLNDAENLQNTIDLNYTNIDNPQQIFARIDNGTYCYGIAEFGLNVVQVPEVNLPSTIITCDNDYDGVSSFDLTVSEFEILDVRNDDIVITYFETEDDLNADNNVISNPDNYNNIANPQTVFVKVTNTISSCYAIVPLELEVNLPPTINNLPNIETCDNEVDSYDLNIATTILIDDLTNVNVAYYLSFIDAENQQNEISTTYNYTSNSDTIYIRADNTITSCFAISSFNLVVNPLPIANQPNDIEACDDDTNDTIAEFNLDAQTNAVLGTQDTNTFTVSYHDSDANANNNNDELTSPYQGQNNQTIYVRIENNITGCYSTTSFLLIVNPHPEVPQPMYNCDIDYDSITTFDLTNSETDLFPVIDNDIIITYFNSMEDLDNNTNIIANPTNYTNISNPQTVFVKVYNTTAQCYWSVPLELNVLLPPVINDIPNIEICDNDADTFDFNNATELLINNTTNVTTTYYLSYNDAENQQNALDNIYTYNGTSETIFVRAEINTTNCFAISSFNLIVNPNPVANIPNDLYACDDDYDFLLDFNFGQQTNAILGGQNPNQFTVTYHELEIEAFEGTNPISNVSYQAFDEQTIYVRVENNTTSCFDTTQFITHVNRKPLVEIPDQVICLDNLPLTVFAGELVNGDTYLWSTNETASEIEIDAIGTYWVTVTSPSGCETTTHFNVIESEAATIEVTEILDFSDPNNITLTISGIGNYLYILDDGEPQESSVFENVTLGYHTITIIDLNGCAQVTKEVVVVDAPKFMTPNNDGYFDTWHIIGVETLPGTTIQIFDRYGKQLAYLSSSSQGWDGTYNGELMPAADYWFVANVKKDDIQFEVKGHFALRR